MRPARSSAGTGRSTSALWSPFAALPRGPVSGSFWCARCPVGQVAEPFGSRFWPPGCDAPETEESGGLRPSSASRMAGRLPRLRRTGGDCLQCPLSEMWAWRRSHDVR